MRGCLKNSVLPYESRRDGMCVETEIPHISPFPREAGKGGKKRDKDAWCAIHMSPLWGYFSDSR